MAIWWLLIKIKNPESSTESRFKMVGRGRRLARSRLTGLRIFFSQAALAPKKTPSPSAHSRFAPGKACALQVLIHSNVQTKKEVVRPLLKIWAGVDSNHRTLARTDLQSVAFSHSATYPYLIFNLPCLVSFVCFRL